MKAVVLQEDLNYGLNTVSRSVSSRPQLPILSNILLSLENGRLRLSGTNLETGINLWIGAQVDEEGSLTVPAKVISEFVASLSPVKIQLAEDKNILHLNSENFKASFNGLSSEEYPKIPSFPENSFLTLEPEVFRQASAQVCFAAAAEDSRPALTGVLFLVSEEGVSMVATDGYRLSVKRFAKKEAQKTEKPIKLLIPSRAILEVSRLSQEVKNEEDLRLGLTKEGNQLVFGLGEVEFSSRLIESEFPDFEKIIPKESSHQVSFDHGDFLRATRTASVFARESANIIKLKLNSDSISISANSPQVGENETRVEAKVEGGEMEIAFNYRFLLDFLNAISGGEVVFEVNDPASPGVFKSSQDKDFLHLIMPVRVRG